MMKQNSRLAMQRQLIENAIGSGVSAVNTIRRVQGLPLLEIHSQTAKLSADECRRGEELLRQMKAECGRAPHATHHRTEPL